MMGKALTIWDDAMTRKPHLVPVSPGTIANWRKAEKIPFVRLAGGRRVIYNRPSVEAALLRMWRRTMNADLRDPLRSAATPRRTTRTARNHTCNPRKTLT
jgi:hypothetical protein